MNDKKVSTEKPEAETSKQTVKVAKKHVLIKGKCVTFKGKIYTEGDSVDDLLTPDSLKSLVAAGVVTGVK